MSTLIGGPRSIRLALETRKQSSIDNDFEQGASTPGMLAQAQDYKDQYLAALHRLDTVTISFNCHGLTFGSRRTQIRHASEIERILQDDGYRKLGHSEILPGDIAIWRSTKFNDIEHSGIIMEVHGDGIKIPKILSKWGRCHEVIHLISDCPYEGNVEFYRLT
jgi:hypothetical protein